MDALSFQLTTYVDGQKIDLWPSVIHDGNLIWLVDCGYEGSLPIIKEQLARHNIDMDMLTGVIISHDDIDHIGGLYEIIKAYPSLKVFSSQIEAPYLSGLEKSLRLKQAEKLFEKIPDGQKAWALEFQRKLKEIKRVSVDEVLDFDAVLSNEVRIINTPGHTPGHISIYLPNLQTLIANDAVVVENGHLEIANPAFALDLDQAVQSIKKISKLNIAKLNCYHGGIVENDIPEKLNRLILKYQTNNYGRL